jgi:hypothetical protein
MESTVESRNRVSRLSRLSRYLSGEDQSGSTRALILYCIVVAPLEV